MTTADLIAHYWYLIVRNPLWLAGLLPGIDPRAMTARDTLRIAAHYLTQERQPT